MTRRYFLAFVFSSDISEVSRYQSGHTAYPLHQFGGEVWAVVPAKKQSEWAKARPKEGGDEMWLDVTEKYIGNGDQSPYRLWLRAR